MKKILTLLLLCLPCMSSMAQTAVMSTHTLSWSEIEKLPLPAPGTRIAYGPAPQHFGELRLPEGKGPFPVAILIHGGCWLSDFDYVHATRIAEGLAKNGIAVWTIEYRRLGDGGGWPETFRDVAQAADFLHHIAKTQPLDLQRVVAVGHSAGGQLALWLAARAKLPKSSELYFKQPLKLTGVVGLAAITDLERYRAGAPDSCNASVEKLLGGTPQTQPLRYAQTSPLALLPLGVPQWLVQGDLDRIVPAAGVSAYADAARAKGDRVVLSLVRGAGHFEMVAPESSAWAALLTSVQAALASSPK